MRAGRLVSLLLLLEARGRMTGAQLASELEVSERTVLRDIDELSGAGVPVFAQRGPGGGFELLEGYRSGLAAPFHAGPTRRARVRISPEGRRLAAVLDRLQPIRVRRGTAADGWVDATFRVGPIAATALEVLSLGPEIEVLAPADLRRRVADLATVTAELYAADHP
ncbi:MAG: transcriptional regulator [Ilumatobacteraceae bacterium]